MSYLETAVKCPNLLPYFQALADYNVIEIGPGGNPVNAHFPCRTYASASQPYSDGLSFLRQQPDASAVVVPFGVMDDFILGFAKCYILGSNLAERYARELAREIKRVIKPLPIVFAIHAKNIWGP